MHIGSEEAKKVWHLPEKLLKSKSTFFTAALEDGWAEGISKIITLPEENPDVFQWFVSWLYAGYDPIAQVEGRDFLVILWALGDRLGCRLMQDDAMCDLVEHHREFHIAEDTLRGIYEMSTPQSKIRQFAIDQCLFDVRVGSPEGHDICSYSQFAKDNEDFAQQLAVATILLGSEEPNDPSEDESPYLFAPSSCPSITESGS